ncbi:MAG: hypothetical protein LC114_06185 [Bryobacterales bacterium]|nr:hypothetical protein [Bryobacterales bacterium]
MSTCRWLSFLLGPALFASVVSAADLSSYRGFVFGSDITSIATLTGLKATDAKLIHQRPALLQEIEWTIRAPLLADPPRPDPVTGAVLCFFDGKLYRIVVAYDRYRIEGMTVDDMIEAISQTYGAARRPETELRLHSYFAEVVKVLARWEDPAYAYDLVRTDDRTSFALVLYSKAADELAQAAIQEATRLDALDAPRRAQEAENKRLEQGRLALEKSRAANKPNFRP